MIEPGRIAEKLSRRELEVFRLLAEGRHHNDVGEALGIKASTVSTYRARIFDKLEVNNIADLAVLALRGGFRT